MKSHVFERYKEGILESQSTNLYDYDKKGNLLSKTDQEYDAKSDSTTISFQEKLSYNDKQKLLVKTVDENGDGETDIDYAYVYDEASHLLKEVEKSTDGSREIVTLYDYSSEGLLLKEEIKSNNEIEVVRSKSYNSVGKEISSSSDYDGDGVLDYASKTFYDEEGNRMKEESYEQGILSSFNTYNSDGKRTENNRGTYGTKFTYDEQTAVLRTKVLEESSGRMSISDYDEQGELVKEVDENGNVLYIVETR
jgi:hypothetical protein